MRIQTLIAKIVLPAAGLLLCAAYGPLRKAAMDPCLKEVKEIYDRMYTVLPKENQVYFFNYHITSTLSTKDKAGKNIVNQSDINLYTSKTQYRFISSDIALYQDKVNKFTVIPSRKLIYWADSDMKTDHDNQLNRMRNVQDTIFSYAEVIECAPLTQQDADKKLSVKLAPKVAAYMQIDKVTYYVDSRQRELKRLRIDYPPAHEVLALDFVFHTADFNYTKLKMEPVKSLFIEGKNTLKDPYKGYKLVDVRKKK